VEVPLKSSPSREISQEISQTTASTTSRQRLEHASGELQQSRGMRGRRSRWKCRETRASSRFSAAFNCRCSGEFHEN